MGLREALAGGTTDAEVLFWMLAIADIRDAADVLREVYDASAGADGFVPLELPPRLSHHTGGSVEFGVELFARLHRPNVMIKVPGTANDRLPAPLHNRLGVASAQLAYAAHQHVLASERWQRLADGSARPQRLLWASTSTKDPLLPQTFYVQAPCAIVVVARGASN